jgi:hypothetical protein
VPLKRGNRFHKHLEARRDPLPAQAAKKVIPGIMELWSHSLWGTGAEFKPQISMNVHPGLKHFCNRGSRLRIVTRTEHYAPRSRRQVPGTELLPVQTRAGSRPARELMIFLGWLRLFQRIVSPNHALGHRGFKNEQYHF